MSSNIYDVPEHKALRDQAAEALADVISVQDLLAYEGQQTLAPWQNAYFDGDKFYGGFGTTLVQYTDYWTLRQRSSQLFKENLYAKGLIRRLITNEINTGLLPEACPDEDIIGVPEDSLLDWTETVENRFGIWAKNPKLCDWERKDTFGKIQRTARLEALIAGDILVVLHQNSTTKLPQVQLIDGSLVVSPLSSQTTIRAGNTVEHGVELDAQRRQVAYWVRQKNGDVKRIPAWGEKSKRRISWMVYGTEKRHCEVRGEPLLSIILQSLKEIDRYRDATTRKAVINSLLAMFIEKGEDKPSSLPLTGGAVRKESATVTDSDGKTRTFNSQKHVPGLIIEELQHGEKPVPLGGQGTDAEFGKFEEAVIQAIAWANEIPPEILRLAFSNNYSASQAAINEFKIYLNMIWSTWGETFCSPIYVEWLLAETLLQKINAPGLLESWRDPMQYDVYGAWISADWYGSIKPSTDMLKQAKGSKMLVDEGWSTNAREARITTGTKFSKNIKRLKRENEMKAEAMEPLIELKNKLGNQVPSSASTPMDDAAAEIKDLIEEQGAA